MLLPVPVRVSVPLPSMNNDPAPVIAPENVVEAPVPPTRSAVSCALGPITTLPPPASEPMVSWTWSAMLSVAPELTVTAALKGSPPSAATTTVPLLILVSPE